MATQLPLILLYWGRIRNDLPWLLLAILILSIPTWQWQAVETVTPLSLLATAGRYITLFLPLFCLTLALRWFSWSIDKDLMESKSNLPPYLALAPVPTYYLSLFPIVGGVIVTLIGWMLYDLGELPQGESFARIEMNLRQLPNTKWAIAALGLSCFIWCQAISWQHFSLRGIRLLLLLAIQIVFAATTMGWLIYQSFPVVPIFIIALLGVIGVLYSLRVTFLARHDVNQEKAWFWQKYDSQKSKKIAFQSAVAAQANCDFRQHWFEFPIVAFLIGLKSIQVLNYNISTQAPWHIFLNSFFFAVLVVPLMMAWFSGIDFGTFRTNRSHYRRKFDTFFAALPLTTGQFITAKIIASVKSLWLIYTLLLIFASLCHYSQVQGIFWLWQERFGAIEAFLLLAMSFASMIGLVGLSHLSAFWTPLLFRKIPFPGFVVLILGTPLLLLSLLAWLEDMSIFQYIEHYATALKIAVLLLAVIKVGGIIYFVKAIRRLNIFSSVIWYIGSIFALTVLFLSYIFIRHFSVEQSYPLLLMLVFILTPGMGLLWYFPLLHRARHA